MIKFSNFFFDLCEQFIKDIKDNINAWAAWFGFEDDYSKADPKLKKEILKGIKNLEQKLEAYKIKRKGVEN